MLLKDKLKHMNILRVYLSKTQFLWVSAKLAIARRVPTTGWGETQTKSGSREGNYLTGYPVRLLGCTGGAAPSTLVV